MHTRFFRALALAGLLATATIAVPVHASGPGGGGGGGGTTTTVSFKTFKMAGALFTTGTPRLLAGGMAYSLDPSGRAKLVVGYLNTAHVPAGTTLSVNANGVKIGSIVTAAQGGALTLSTSSTVSVPALTLQSRIDILDGASVVASGNFTLNI
jgi:hypothetical protein